MDVSGLPSIPEKYKAVLDAYRALKGYPVTPLHDLTHRAIASIGPGKHVLDIGCGLEKSVGASVLASVSPTPVWLVCEHHRACGDVLRRLAEMGTDMSEVAYIPGFGRQSCIMYDDFHMGDISPVRFTTTRIPRAVSVRTRNDVSLRNACSISKLAPATGWS